MKKLISTAICFLFATNIFGCAKRASSISSSYVSTAQHSGYSCKQISREMLRVHKRVIEISGKQDAAATKDAVALGVGLFLFWPALFFMVGGDKKEELARLKGEYEALNTLAIEMDCDLAKEQALIEDQTKEYKNPSRN